MNFLLRQLLLGALLTFGAALPALAGDQPGPSSAVVARALVAELAAACPPADPSSQPSFDTCRDRLYHSPTLKQMFYPRVTWGGWQANVPVRDLKLTTFDRDLFIGLYLPLFVFSGEFEIVESPGRTDWKDIRVRAAFRDRLPPGQYPYPFWHSKDKWTAYDQTTALIFHIDPLTGTVWTALRAPDPKVAPLSTSVIGPRDFDGKWMWTDADGKTEPAVTLYDGLFAKDNPFKAPLETAFQSFALELRNQSCSSCHAPDNKSSMSPLVLLMTPAHAAGEIDRVIRLVDAGKMPLSETGQPEELSPAAKAAFIDQAKNFKAAVDQAKAWEATHPAK